MILIKKSLLCLFLIGASISSFAQDNPEESNAEAKKTEIKVGAKAGYSLGNLTSRTENVYTEDYESVSGIDFGLTFEFKLTELISIQTELNYTQRGGVRNGLQPVTGNELSEQLNMFFPFVGLPAITNENPLYASFDSESDLQYLEVPALVKFGWGDDFRFSAAIGPYVGILLKATQITSGTSQFYLDSEGINPVFVPGPDGQPPYTTLPAQSLDAKTNIKDDLKTVNFGGTFALGISKKLSESSQLFLDARASYGFNAIQINDEYGESNIGGVIFSLGYAHILQ
tara:strand:- start:2151 stop:3005 length:855 start_codon:yes stop_codon:yes gene_type:complete